MSLRKQARILGIAPSYLSMLVNGKRKWPDDLRYRYSELVNSVVNTEGKEPYENTGAQEGIRTPTPDKGKRILSWLQAIMPCVSLAVLYLRVPCHRRSHGFDYRSCGGS